MPMNAQEIEELIKARFPDAEVTIRDLAGDGDHYAAHVVAREFAGKSRVQQHKMVYDALQGRMGGVLHALALTTAARPKIDFARGLATSILQESRPRERLHALKGPAFMSQQAIHDWIRKTVAGNDVVLFMKGTKNFPQCGFSSQVAQILAHAGVAYQDVNVLDSLEVREGIKSFTNWPTIPQLYVKGEFVGGCDIIREMFQAGELQQLLEEKGIAHHPATMTA